MEIKTEPIGKPLVDELAICHRCHQEVEAVWYIRIKALAYDAETNGGYYQYCSLCLEELREMPEPDEFVPGMKFTIRPGSSSFVCYELEFIKMSSMTAGSMVVNARPRKESEDKKRNVVFPISTLLMYPYRTFGVVKIFRKTSRLDSIDI